jgi:hypothetical protein
VIPGLSGSLLSHDALAGWLPAQKSSSFSRHLGPLHARLAATWQDLGPAHGARTIYDRVVTPLAAALGLRLTLDGQAPHGLLLAKAEADGHPCAAVVVFPWGADPGQAWRTAVHQGIARSVRWCLCFNGPSLRIVDARRTYTRRHAEIDLQLAAPESAAAALVHALLRAEAFAGPDGAALDRAVTISERHRASVRASLQEGVHDAVTQLMGAFARSGGRRGPRRDGPAVFDESLTVVYRVLFLLFAEARGLVPSWHPTYRDGYTIESLRRTVEVEPRPRGLWESLQAIARLAHRGCRAGELRVPPFNGRLFSPALAPLADSMRLNDGAVREALLALTTRPGRWGRERISYADLGVEQLGGVYERILDYAPGGEPGAPALVRGGRRKASGSFYTPRGLTEFVVRRTLAPLVRDAGPDEILTLRVLDPAMGSGAFLVAACRYLAGAYEASLGLPASELDDRDRAGFRRTIAQRCLYGVDLNPMAVQLGRLSLWLATLAGDRPLTFLDHHLRAGNSLVGAALADLARRRPPGRSGRMLPRAGAMPLFEYEDAGGALATAVGPRLALARDPDDTLEQVRDKERTLAALGDRRAPLGQWKAAADLWCAGWFGGDQEIRVLRSTFGALADELLQRARTLPPHTSGVLLETVRATAERERFFHWALEFPEVFSDPDGQPLERPGFDAVIGNPPWEVLRGDSGSADDRRVAAVASSRLTTFARGSGVYTLQGEGHANLFQLFIERSLSLVRRGGRAGLVLPSGFATDHGCAALRRHVLDRTMVDACVSIENRDALFPIHRGLKFVVLCTTTNARTTALPYRAGIRSPDALDRMPDMGPDSDAVAVPRTLLDRLSGAQAVIPEIRSAADLALVARVTCAHPALGDTEGWGVRFGRELNATDDRKHFVRRERPPDPECSDGAGRTRRDQRAREKLCAVVEGKQIQPFAVDVAASRFAIPALTAGRLLDPDRTFGRPRLAYRDVSSATNRVTLIAAILPAGVVTTHTLFCLKSQLDGEGQRFLCGVFNSFVANYLVRLRVTTHVTVAIIDRLPVPRPGDGAPAFMEIASLAAVLARRPRDLDSAARLQASVARLYGLTIPEFQLVLDSFPLVEIDFRERCAALFREAEGGGLSGERISQEER